MQKFPLKACFAAAGEKNGNCVSTGPAKYVILLPIMQKEDAAWAKEKERFVWVCWPMWTREKQR